MTSGTLAVVVDITVAGVGAWIAIVLGLFAVVGALWKVGRVVHGCFDGLRTEVKDLRGAVEDLAEAAKHEAELQRERHKTNLATLAEQRRQILQIDQDVDEARRNIAVNTAVLARLGPT